MRMDLRRAVERHHGLVFRVAFGVLRRSEDAEDVTQEAFLRLVRVVRADEEPADVEAWLATVALNLARTRLRGDGRRRAREEAYAAERTEAPMATRDETSARLDALESALGSLPEAQRVPLELHYRERLKHRQIAAILSWPIGTVSSRIAKARAALRVRLQSAAPAVVALIPEVDTEPGLLAELAQPVPAHLETTLMDAIDIELTTMAAATSGSSAALSMGPSTAAWGAAALILAGGFWWASAAPSPATPSQPTLAQPPANHALAAAATTPQEEPTRTLVEAVTPPEEVASMDMRLEGRVVDTLGRPLAGATVRVSTDASDTTLATTRTDAEGAFAFTGLPPVLRRIHIDPDKDLLSQLSQLIPERATTAGSESEEVALDDLTAALLARSSGMEETAASESTADTSDWRPSRGMAQQSLTQSPSSYRVQAITAGYAPAMAFRPPLPDGSLKPVELRLAQARPLSGVVRANGQPIAGAEVHVVARSGADLNDRFFEFGDWSRVRTTGPDGSFAFESMADGLSLLQVHLDDHTSAPVWADAGTHDTVLHAQTAADVTALVLDAAQRPIVGAQVDFVRDGIRLAERTTGPDGRVTFDNLPLGAGAFCVRHGSFVAVEVAHDIKPHDMRLHELHVPHLAHLELTLRRGPDSPRGIHTSVQVIRVGDVPGSQWVSVRDDDETLTVDALPAGTYDIVVMRLRDKGTSDGMLDLQRVTLAPGETRALTLNTEPIATATLAIQPVDEHGRPLEACNVYVHRSTGAAQERRRLGDAPWSLDVAPGDAIVQVRSSGRVEQWRTVENLLPGALRTLTIEMPPLPEQRLTALDHRTLQLHGGMISLGAYVELLSLRRGISITSSDALAPALAHQRVWQSNNLDQLFKSAGARLRATETGYVLEPIE